MVSTRPLISKSSSLFSFGDCTKRSNYSCYHRHFHVPWGFFFTSLARSTYLSLFKLSFLFTLWFVRTAKSTIRQVLFLFLIFFFFLLLTITRSGRDLVICLYIKIPEKFMHLTLQDGFWIVHVPFVHIVKFKFLTQFPVDNSDIITIIIISIIVSFFTLTLAFDLSLGSEWQHVSSGLQDSFEYYNRSQDCCGLNRLDSFSDY